MLTIAALLTAHNRRDTTLSALESLFAQEIPRAVRVVAFVVDDGSRDSTADCVRRSFPEVRLIEGNGNLYWNGGMRMAFAEANSEGYAFYLWLNDDTCLYPDAVARLVGASAESAGQAIIIGTTQDPETGEPTYGGVERASFWHPFRYRLVPPGGVNRPVQTMNGNCVLIPAAVANIVGNLDPTFTHGMGDFDYGYRARRNGFNILVAPGYFGTCRRNRISGTWRDPALPIVTRLKILTGAKGLPVAEWLAFTSRYGGMFWPVFWLATYLRFLGEAVLLRRGQRAA